MYRQTDHNFLLDHLKFRRAVNSCLETDTSAGDRALSIRRIRGLQGHVALGMHHGCILRGIRDRVIQRES